MKTITTTYEVRAYATTSVNYNVNQTTGELEGISSDYSDIHDCRNDVGFEVYERETGNYVEGEFGSFEDAKAYIEKTNN